jgi:phage shock protein A
MATLLQKIRTLISASMHSILDRALQQNSVVVFDEYIRQAQTSMEMVRGALIDLRSTVKTLKVRYDEAANDAAEFDMQIDAALKANQAILAKAIQVKLNNQLNIARTYKEQYEKQSRTYTTLQEVVQVLQAKVDTLQSQRDQVAALLELIRSKNIIARSLKDVEKITDSRTKEIVDDVMSKLDVADSRLEVATTRLSDQIDQEVGDASLEAQLEERRQKLGLS